MPLWRCPHCGTPQAEASRCWVCHRSTTSCATCRQFRKGVAGGLGMCGLDPRHTALRGTEIRACWTPPVALEEAEEPVSSRTSGLAASPGAPAVADSTARRPRTFVPVEDLERERRAAIAVTSQVPLPEPPADLPARVVAPPSVRGWSLWGDLER